MVKSNELVWVDTGEGPIKAVCGQPDKRMIFIHEPVQKKFDEVGLGETILDTKTLAYYRDAIANVERKKKLKQAKSLEK